MMVILRFTHEGGEDIFNSDIRVLVRNITNGSIAEWDPVSDENAQALRTGGETTLNFDEINSGTMTTSGPWIDSWDNYNDIGTDSTDIEFNALDRNQRYRVMLIHDESGRVVADQTVTAR